jgi:DNA-binding NtrC family response regulator
MTRKMNFETTRLSDLPLSRTSPGGELKPLVLVVDDEALIADTCAMILERNGVIAMVAYDAKSALEVAAAFAPDLLLSDVAMPEMNGLDLALAIKEVLPQCGILLFSGQASSMDWLNTARGAGREFTILAKPLHPTELIAQVLGALQSRFRANPNVVADQQMQISLPIPAQHFV